MGAIDGSTEGAIVGPWENVGSTVGSTVGAHVGANVGESVPKQLLDSNKTTITRKSEKKQVNICQIKKRKHTQ